MYNHTLKVYGEDLDEGFVKTANTNGALTIFVYADEDEAGSSSVSVALTGKKFDGTEESAGTVTVTTVKQVAGEKCGEVAVAKEVFEKYRALKAVVTDGYHASLEYLPR